MITILENNKRISESTILLPFKMSKDEDRFITVDKLITGNGGSTAFLRLPIKVGYVNLLIAPNVAVVEDKEAQYIKNEHGFFNDIDMRFIYGGAMDKNIGANVEGRYPDVIVMVIDSFFIYEELLQKYNVDKILIDEAHSIVQQSAFRKKNLVDFASRVKGMYPQSSIVQLTATPTLFMKVDVLIKTPHVKGFDIHYTRDRADVIKRIKKDIKTDGVEVVVFTNNGQVIKAIKGADKVLEANFILGASLTSNVYKGIKTNNNPNSSLTISSSRGFEGFDIMYNNANVYFFEDRTRNEESFYPSNLVQASGRTRKGANKVTYCRLPVNTKKKDVFKDIDVEVEEFINDTRYSAEAKNSKHISSKPNNQKSKPKVNIYLDYIISKTDKDGVSSVHKNQDAVDLYKEKRVCDREFPLKEYEGFFEDRGISFINDDTTINRNKMINGKKIEKMVENLLFHKDEIKEKGLYDDMHKVKWDFSLNQATYKVVKAKMLFNYEVFLAEKNYDGGYKLKPHQEKIRELLSYEVKNKIIIPNGTFEALREELIEMKKDKLSEKDWSIEDKQLKLEHFEEHSVLYLSQILYIMADYKAYVPKKAILHRDYNFSTQVPYRMIEHVMRYLGISITEVDIVSCNIRIIYAKCGLKLPKDIYGENKEHKTAINKLLNNFMYNEQYNSSRKLQKSRSKKELTKYFDPIVVDYLMDTYFDVKFNYRGQLTSDCAFHEMKIIAELKKDIKGEYNDGVIRRHDSLVLFNNEQPLGFLVGWDYSYFIGVGGWFSRDEVMEDMLNENDVLTGNEQEWNRKDKDVA